MNQERTFQLQLKNDQVIELKFSSISVANNQLWQMFATTEALDTLQQLIDQQNTIETKSARKTPPKKSTNK
jgi:TPP-dependent 2-oxoacid decarboxylase